MITLHSSSFPEACLPTTPKEYLSVWKKRVGLRNHLTSQALKFLNQMEADKLIVCEQAPDPILEGLKWTIYQDHKDPKFFVVVGRLENKEFATVQYLPEKTRILERENFSVQRLSQFRKITEKMKEDFLGVTSSS